MGFEMNEATRYFIYILEYKKHRNNLHDQPDMKVSIYVSCVTKKVKVISESFIDIYSYIPENRKLKERITDNYRIGTISLLVYIGDQRKRSPSNRKCVLISF